MNTKTDRWLLAICAAIAVAGLGALLAKDIFGWGVAAETGTPTPEQTVIWAHYGDQDPALYSGNGRGQGETWNIPQAEATLRLFTTGNFTPDMREHLGEEDGPLVEHILNWRKGY